MTQQSPGARPDLGVRHPAPHSAVIDVTGDLTAQSQDDLASAYQRADRPGVRGVVLNFSAVEYMNSGGLGALVTLLVRAKRQNRQLVAYGLSDHYRQILSVTRLDEAIAVHADEAAAVGAVAGGARP